jgi:hypothetical protein
MARAIVADTGGLDDHLGFARGCAHRVNHCAPGIDAACVDAPFALLSPLCLSNILTGEIDDCLRAIGKLPPSLGCCCIPFDLANIFVARAGWARVATKHDDLVTVVTEGLR